MSVASVFCLFGLCMFFCQYIQILCFIIWSFSLHLDTFHSITKHVVLSFIDFLNFLDKKVIVIGNQRLIPPSTLVPVSVN